MIDHLKEAKNLALSSAEGDVTIEWSQVTAILAIAHALIALVEMLSSNFEENVEEEVDRRVPRGQR